MRDTRTAWVALKMKAARAAKRNDSRMRA
jgi:hypothetical protein